LEEAILKPEKNMARKSFQLGKIKEIRRQEKENVAVREKARQERRQSKRALIVLGLLVLTTFSFGAMTNWRNQPVASNAPPSGTPPPMPANAPAKEYVYAGSALISTVESFRQPPNDLAVWRPSDGVWYILNSQQQLVAQQWGIASDKPAPGDFDGDGKTDFCVYRPDNPNTPENECQNGCIWYIINSSNGAQQYSTFGINEDIPAVADYDGDGKSDLAVWRPSNQYWYILKSSNGAVAQAQFGAAGDKPIPADFDGDGKADYAVWRDGTATFWVQKSSDNQWASYSIGQTGDNPVVGDYDGDGQADYAVRGNRDNFWRIRYSSTGNIHYEQWGWSSDIAVPGRYNDSVDNDAKTDIAVWRPSIGVWYIRRSNDGSMRAQQFGMQGDIPVPSNWRR
jgi:hypothetical protein